MIGIRKRRSIVFQLWIRLSTTAVAFTLLALGGYVWLEIADKVETAHDQAVTSAIAVASALTRLQETASLPGERELAMARTLDIVGVQFIAPDGTIRLTYGELTGEGALDPVDPELLADVSRGTYGYDVEFMGTGLRQHNISPMDLLRGGEYGSMHVMPSSSESFVGSLRIITDYPDLPGEARTLFLRALALTGGILAVIVAGLWVLLDRLVARPLREYSTMAGRIAAGEPIRMPDIGNNELGQLGQAINGMADILRHQASIDMLTGLYNLRHLTDRLEDLLVEARERGEPLALLVCDLDNLKPVNDTHGHHVGDLLLRAVARELLAWCNVAYTCWRTGGDEFAAVIPGADLERARREVDALQQAINGRTIPVPGGQIPISLSIGIATYPADGTTGSALMEVADQRMYESKSHKVKPGMPAPAA